MIATDGVAEKVIALAPACAAFARLCPALPATLACDWTSLLVPTLTVCRAVRGAQSWTRRLGRHVFKGDVHNHAGGGGITGE